MLQFALSVLLVTSAGLAYRSMSTINSGDVGFPTDRLLLVTVRAARQFASAEPTAMELDAGFAGRKKLQEGAARVQKTF